MFAAPPPPYRSGMAAGLGVVLTAGLVLAVVDIVHTGGGVDAMPPLLALWALIALPLALVVGLILGAGNATWGTGWVMRAFRRLRADASLDRAVSAALVAAAVLAAILALGISQLAVGLVGEVQRKAVGGLLLGVVIVCGLPLVALGTLPIYRLSRRLTAQIPPVGPLSRVVMLLIAAALAGAASGLYIITHRLDYRALDLASLFVPALLPVVAIGIAVLVYGPAAAWRERIQSRGLAALAGLVIALWLPLLALGTPSEAVQTAVVDHSYVGGRMIAGLRKLIDRDGDGYSAFFGGPDCDDGNPNVHPGAIEIPGNGIDDNCAGGDAPLEPATATAQARPAATAALSASAMSRLPTAPPSANGGKNVLIIFVDTLRFDRLGVSGYRRADQSLTPRLDAFAAQSVVFRRAYSQAPNTPRSVPSFLTSHYPSQVKVDKHFKNYSTMLDDNVTLFEVLRPAGFHTVGESSHFYFCDRKHYPDQCPDVASWMKPNVLQGADEWDNNGALNIPESNRDTAGPRVVKKTTAKLRELARSGTRFAMIVHLFEPHSSYVEHDGFTYVEHGTAGLAEKYDYEVAFEDGQIGNLLDALDATGLAKTTTVVLMADHGEAFGTHAVGGKPAFFHGDMLYSEVLHVPLIFRVPGAAPAVRDDVVQLIDLAPTITALFGVAPSPTWQGRSLAPAIAGKQLEPRPAFAELIPDPEWDHEAKSMITADGAHHIYYKISESRWEAYDLNRDPDEKTNLASAPWVAELEHALVSWIEGPLAAGGGK